jgi:hypothetical protein
MELITTSDWLLAKDLLICGQDNICLDLGYDKIIVTPDYFKQQLHGWRQFRVTGRYPENFKQVSKLENSFFLFCTRSNHCFSFVDPEEMKAVFDANYRTPRSLWKHDKITRQYRQAGETFFSVILLENNEGKININTDYPIPWIRYVCGSLTIERCNYPTLLESLPMCIETVIFNIEINQSFDHCLHIKLIDDSNREQYRHTFNLTAEGCLKSHLDFIQEIAQSFTLPEIVEHHESF